MDLDSFFDKLKNNEILTEKEMREVCLRCMEIMSNESNV